MELDYHRFLGRPGYKDYEAPRILLIQGCTMQDWYRERYRSMESV